MDNQEAMKALGDGPFFALYELLADAVPRVGGIPHWVVVYGVVLLIVIILVVLIDRLWNPCNPSKAPSSSPVRPRAQYTDHSLDTVQPPVRPKPSPGRTRHTTTTTTQNETRTRPYKQQPVYEEPVYELDNDEAWADEVNAMSVAQRRAALKARGLQCFGPSQMLAARLIEAGPSDDAQEEEEEEEYPVQREPVDDDDDDDDDDVSMGAARQMSVSELREELALRNLNCFGPKEALVKRLAQSSKRPLEGGTTSPPKRARATRKRGR